MFKYKSKGQNMRIRLENQGLEINSHCGILHTNELCVDLTRLEGGFLGGNLVFQDFYLPHLKRIIGFLKKYCDEGRWCDAGRQEGRSWVPMCLHMISCCVGQGDSSEDIFWQLFSLF